MTLTVAVPSYNKEKYIERCLKSILAEKKYIDRIILVDNCSTDRTFEIAKKFAPNVECFRNDANIGMSPNWNRCIDLCTTDWLMIVHADDEILPGSISKYIDLIQKHPSIALVHADSYSIVDDNASTKSIYQKNKKEFWKAGIDAMSCEYGVCSAVMVKKEAYDALGHFIASSLASDAEMWARIAGKYDIGYINSPTVIFHVNSASTGYDSLVNRKIKDIKADWDLLTNQRAKSYPTKESQDAFLAEYARLAPYSYWAVVKANLRAHHFIKVFQTLWLIVFTYHGFFPLLKLIFGTAKKVMMKKLGREAKVA